MAVLTAAEYGAVDPAAGDVHFGFCDVRPGVEEHALVALACAEEVAGHGVSGNLFQRAWHTEGGCAAEVHRTCAVHVGLLVTAINARQDVAASDVHHGVATHGASLAVPLADLVRVLTRTAAEHVAIVGVAVGSQDGTTLGVVTRNIGILVVWSVG